MKQVGDYTITEQLGKNHFGCTYKAVKKSTKEVFTLKAVQKAIIDQCPRQRELLDLEINLMWKIKHPNVLHLYEHVESAHNHYLVIDYCNLGNLQEYVTSKKYLGEEESIYFLMQMMNGLKKLYDEKIIHKQLNLEHIYLKDDVVKIGNLGFAKSGAKMMTAQLGKPITVAPELAKLEESGGSACYSNKVDLWSVGICFFEMIFGRAPWTPQQANMGLENISGANLHIPSQPGISPECAQLLRRLIEPNPELRITWDDFFKHPLFVEKSPSEKSGGRNSTLSMDHLESVVNLFKNNRLTKQKTIEQMDALHLRLDVNSLTEIPTEDSEHQGPESEKEKMRLISLAKKRYVHEMKIIEFIINSCVKLRKLAVRKNTFGNYTKRFMYAELLLLKKGIITNERVINSLKLGRNDYGIQNFSIFHSTQLSKVILMEFKREQRQDFSLMKNLLNKFETEVRLDSPRSKQVYELCSHPSSSLELINSELRTEAKKLLEYYLDNMDIFDQNIIKELKIALSHLYYSCQSEIEFGFNRGNGVTFDWIEFENKIQGFKELETDSGIEIEAEYKMEFIDSVLSRASEDL